MITFSQLGSKGRLGNQLWQIASTMGIAAHNKTSFCFNRWDYCDYFEKELPFQTLFKGHREGEIAFNYTDYHIGNDVDLSGYFQSEKYFKHIEKEIRDQFDFKNDIVNHCLSLLPNNGRKNIAIHVRRGDYVGNPSHYNLSIRYYLNAIESFGNWQEYNLVFFSDDQEYAKFYFGCLPNSYFMQGSEIEDLCTMSLCDHFIIANSSFSWWGAWLNKNTHSKIVIRPQEHFDGNQLKHDIKDLYPPEWKVISDKEKPALLDTTFIIPIKYDHQDRKQNLELSLKHLTDNFSTNIHIVEQEHPKYQFAYLESEYIDYSLYMRGDFHRTRMINSIAKFVRTPYIVNWDADILLNPVQIWYSVQKLRAGVDIVYPYDGNWVNILRHIHKKFINNLDALCELAYNGPTESWGGAIFMNRSKFLSVGGENEHFISWGPEDAERYVRFLKMRLRVERVKGPIFHLEHYRGSDSGRHNQHLEANRKEWHSIRVMEPDALAAYIKTWPWAK